MCNSDGDRRRLHLLIDVARAYYDNGESQAEISRRIGYSRPTVSRMLQEAKDLGLVKITISHPLERLERLEERICALYGVERTLVSQRSGPIGPPQLAAEFVASQTPRDGLIAVSNGSSISATVDSLPQQHRSNSCVVQMLGSLGRSNPLEDSPEICRRMAAKLGGTYRILPAPLVLDSPATAKFLRQDGQVAAVLELAARADLALVGVGALVADVPGQIFHGWYSADLDRQIARQGAVGHICAHHIDSSGNHIQTPLCRRIIAMDVEKLRTIPQVVAVAWGSEKIAALRAALKGGYINTFVTDEATANALVHSESIG
ncbi:sugar-binding transcriptional regulator [Arcanobacterium bovis]|uniref:Winged helix-turn-helix transcriptional regulator n=1 Tax=Arcanobacterium bovis TaxID=2529275 RepID=A0A4Q9V105_9ACTO|nr:sugar-binding domain-containing protein [Arcanobacterium bovis]TBW21427.1 winged helix-turn-helix transcriptional regulator [Arcanobacterium bovis]